MKRTILLISIVLALLVVERRRANWRQLRSLVEHHRCRRRISSGGDYALAGTIGQPDAGVRAAACIRSTAAFGTLPS